MYKHIKTLTEILSIVILILNICAGMVKAEEETPYQRDLRIQARGNQGILYCGNFITRANNDPQDNEAKIQALDCNVRFLEKHNCEQAKILNPPDRGIANFTECYQGFADYADYIDGQQQQ